MIFRRALIRLTLTYTLVQLILFGAFAFGIYSYVTGAFDLDAAEQEGQSSIETAEAGFATLRMGLLSGYAALVVLLPISSFLMARSALAPVKRSYELQQRFVDGASHEFRTPLSVIQGELELALSRSRSAVQYRAAIATALEAAEGMTRLTSDLLLLTRGSVHELEATFEPVELHSLARELALTYSSARTSIRVIDNSETVVTGSPMLLRRAIANLLDNAAKFSGDSGTVTVTVESTGKVARVVIDDNGIGMTEGEAAHAFDRFWRAQDARATPGFGLGLPLVKQIIEAHGGTVNIASKPGIGSTVTLTVPCDDA